MKKKTGEKKGIAHHLKKHSWDETLVIMVMVVGALGILILLSNYISVLGKAYSSLPTGQGVLNMMGNCQMVSGEAGNSQGDWGRGTKCKLVCAAIGEDSLFAWKGEEFNLAGLDERVGSPNLQEKYHCLCCSSERLVGEVPEEEPEEREEEVEEGEEEEEEEEVRRRARRNVRSCKTNANCPANQRCSNKVCVAGGGAPGKGGVGGGVGGVLGGGGGQIGGGQQRGGK